MPRLSVIIPCKNERHNLAACVQGVRSIADEILIADSGSTDGSLELIEQLGGCRVIEREYVHSGDFKNWAIPQATHPWVLIVDADERVTEALAGEIQQRLERPDEPSADGYWIRRANHFLGHPIRWGNWRRDRVLRLFRRDKGRYEGDTDHAEIAIPDGRTGQLHERLLHYSFWSYSDYFRKFHRYAKWQAERWHASGRRPSLPRLLLQGPARFLQTYLLQLGLLDGLPGLQVCALTAFYSFMKQAYLWELHAARKQEALEPPASPSSGEHATLSNTFPGALPAPDDSVERPSSRTLSD